MDSVIKMIYEVSGKTKAMESIDRAMSVASSLLNLPENVWVNIEMTNCKSNGGCVHLDEEDGYLMFDVDINKKQCAREIVITLLHEMKHVEQYATGRLGQDTWLGQPRPNLPYYDLPWEQEAFDFESRAIHVYDKQLRQALSR